MLNTKSIRKKVFDEIENTDYKSKLNIDTNINNKIIEINDSISSKEIIKLHNENLNAQKENTKMIKDIVNQREINTYVVTTKDNYSNNKIIHRDNNNLIHELATLNKNEANSNPQVIFMAPTQHFTDNLSEKIINKEKEKEKEREREKEINKLTYAEWDENKNSYIIYDNNEIEGFFTNNDIVKSIIQGSNINKFIKKFFFIIAYNKENDINEFIFIDSIFTNNIELMIKTQNSLFDLSNQNELFDNNDEHSNNLLIFNYQFIIYLFKKSNYLNNNESNKIAKFYSTITYRFTTLVLKQTMKIENINITIANDIMKLIDIKNDISSQLTNIESYLSNNNIKNNKNNKNKIKNNKNNKNSNDLINIINITTTDNDTDTDNDADDDADDDIDDDIDNNIDVNIDDDITNDTDNNTDNNTDNDNIDILISKTSEINNFSNIKNKSTYKSKSILDDILTSLSAKIKQDKNYDSEDNGYEEINDNVSSYKDKQISGSIKSTNISATSDNNINNSNSNNNIDKKIHYKIANKHISTTNPSYNKDSAINNGKIYKIKL